MKNTSLLYGMPMGVLLLLLGTGFSNGLFGAEGGQIFIFKPHPVPLKYNLNIETHSELQTGSPRSVGRVFEDHTDNLVLSHAIKAADNGLLDVAITVDKINEIQHAPTRGFNLNREDIVGKSQHVVLNLLGEVKEATGLPFFASPGYYFGVGSTGPTGGPKDGPPFDMYRVLLMLYPQFPLRLIDTKDTWTVKDKITITPSDISTDTVAVIDQDLKMNLSRTTTYTLLGFGDRKGYQTAHIGFKVQHGYDASMVTSAWEWYSDGGGDDQGDFYFAPKEGMVVEASVKSSPVENKSEGGLYFGIWLDPKTMIMPTVRDARSIPLKWRTEKTISYELAATN